LSRISKRLLCLALVLASAGSAAPALAHRAAAANREIDPVVLRDGIRARVILPAGYDTSGKRYPVVYFLHGLPGSSSSYLGNDWVIDALQAAGAAILVMPQGARDEDSDPEYLNWGAGRNWEHYVATELPRYVDAHYRTIRARTGRALVGVSAGGYGSTILGLHHLGTYAVIESWSGYFHPTDPTGTHSLDRGADAIAHSFVGRLHADELHRPTFLAFYVGRGDTRFRRENVQFDRELSAEHVPHLFEVYRGGHQTSLWQRHAVGWLRLALDHLAPPA
jgi:S-formylglutathione hydrolase FrmB